MHVELLSILRHHYVYHISVYSKYSIFHKEIHRAKYRYLPYLNKRNQLLSLILTYFVLHYLNRLTHSKIYDNFVLLLPIELQSLYLYNRFEYNENLLVKQYEFFQANIDQHMHQQQHHYYQNLQLYIFQNDYYYHFELFQHFQMLQKQKIRIHLIALLYLPSIIGLASRICCSILEFFFAPLIAAKHCKICFVDSVLPAPDSPLNLFNYIYHTNPHWP